MRLADSTLTFHSVLSAKWKFILSASVAAMAMTGSGTALAQQAGGEPVREGVYRGNAAQAAGSGTSGGEVGPAPVSDGLDIASPTPPPPDAILPEVEPIIEDDEFRRAIPQITVNDDLELQQPLESIAEFEQRQAREFAEREAAAQAGVAGADAGAGAGGGTPQEPIVPARQVGGAGFADSADSFTIPDIGNAPISDPALADPLQPLESFDVTPVVFAEPEDERSAAQLRYEVVINGMQAADDESDVSLRNLFKGLSALQSGKGRADNIAMLRARLSVDGELVQRIVTSEGYYDAEVSTRIERAGANMPLNAIIDVVPGTRYSFSSIRIDAEPTVPPDLISRNFPLKLGEAIVAERVQGAEAALALRLPESGYPFAEVGQRDILLDGTTGTGDYVLPVTVGTRSRFGNIETTGNLAFGLEHVELLTRFERGDLYNSLLVDDFRQALVATGLFSNVSTEAVPTGEFAEDGTEYVTMVVTQQAGPPRTIAGNVGYGTGEGFRVQGSWTHRNMFPPEGALIGTALLGTREQRLSATMRRSNAGRRDRTFEVVTEVLRSNYDAFEAMTGRVGFRVSRDSTQIWQKKLTYAYGAEIIGTSEDDYNFSTGQRERDFYTIIGLTGQLGIDRTNNLLDPTRGFRLTGLVRPEGSLQGSFTPYAVTQLDGSAYYPVMSNLVLAGRFRIGSILGAERETLAPSRRFYGGGGGSVRGFGYQQLGPKDPNLDPIGGRAISEAAVEARYRFGNFGIVTFLDAGQVYTDSAPDFSDLRYGAGIGARYYTAFGPMRVDLATPLARQPGESRLSVYISIGQAF